MFSLFVAMILTFGSSTFAAETFLPLYRGGEADESVHWRCLLAVQALIESLDLPHLADDRVVVVKLPLADRVKEQGLIDDYPGILISPFGVEQMDPMVGTNRRDDVGYPVVVSIVAADNQALQANLGRYLLWRERIARKFRNGNLGGMVDEVFNAYVEPGQVVLPAAWMAGFWHSSLTIRCISRETRG